MNTLKPKPTAEDLADYTIKLLAQLRFKTKHWEIHFGAINKKSKKYWEADADELLQKLGIDENTKLSQIKIKL